MFSRDIKPQNILLKSEKGEFDERTVNIKDLKVKLADFGLSRFIMLQESASRSRYNDEQPMPVRRTTLIMAPAMRESYANNMPTTQCGK